jgi:hypothetical protein
MSMYTKSRTNRLSPGLLTILGLLLMLGTFAVDVATDPAAANALELSATTERPAG